MLEMFGRRLREVSVRPTVGIGEGNRWDALMGAHHYLPFRGLVGRSVRHVAVLGERWLALVGWVIPPQSNADFAAALEKVLDVYRRPYDAAFPVVCMDETPRQLISETREPVAAASGRPAREDYEYRRCGTCNVFMATEPMAGGRLTKVTARHR